MTQPDFDLSLSALLPLVRDTLKRPRDTAERLLALALPANILWLLLLTVATLSVLLGQATALLLLPAAQSVDAVFLASPLLMAGIQWGILVLTVYAVYGIGRALGGQGDMRSVLTLMCWLQFVMLCVQVVQSVALLLLPGLGEIVTILGFFLFLWLFTVFVGVAHGFRNLLAVFGMIVVSAVAIAFALTFVLSVLGITLGGVGNV